MKIFLDTEFIEKPGSIQLISIGMVKESGEEYYAISSEFDPETANEWVKENVIKRLEPEIERKSMDQIKNEILEFVGDESPEFWAYYADYDWVVFCWIFGTMLQLPPNFPMFCLDLKQEMHSRGFNTKWKREHVPTHANEHNALGDAKWNRDLFNAIRAYPDVPSL